MFQPHVFLIEIGRHLGIERDPRYCTHRLNVQNTCGTENELHVFLIIISFMKNVALTVLLV